MSTSSQEKTAEDCVNAIVLKTGDGELGTRQSTRSSPYPSKVRVMRSAQTLDYRDRRRQCGPHK